MRCFERILELAPGEASAWYNKAKCLQDLNRYEESVVCCGKALELDPALFQAWLAEALSEDALCRWTDAARCYRQFIACSPDKASPHVEFAVKRLHGLEHESTHPG